MYMQRRSALRTAIRKARVPTSISYRQLIVIKNQVKFSNCGRLSVGNINPLLYLFFLWMLRTKVKTQIHTPRPLARKLLIKIKPPPSITSEVIRSNSISICKRRFFLQGCYIHIYFWNMVSQIQKQQLNFEYFVASCNANREVQSSVTRRFLSSLQPIECTTFTGCSFTGLAFSVSNELNDWLQYCRHISL